ncbi:hypothetical protein GCM10010211_75720 [Streptomyces albospinus]|uniref:DUF202 domain-containing protein n=1 Tax=Streptomyces albospinus TaxID=285515 RepID=A0ABQ2VNW4_9ACTN|nr:DUF202 domain-containing protein [Streptomyces albospinus]GGU97302.1 hypothetical protein GCM10010211_75720 [Streptomyces albospinus]
MGGGQRRTAGGGGPAPRPAADRAPGLQPERTRLAWRRTTLSAAAVAVLAGRQLLHSRAPGQLEVALTGLVGLLWLAFTAVADLRMRAMATGRPAPLPPRLALLLVGCTLGTAVCGAALLVRTR